MRKGERVRPEIGLQSGISGKDLGVELEMGASNNTTECSWHLAGVSAIMVFATLAGA